MPDFFNFLLWKRKLLEIIETR